MVANSNTDIVAKILDNEYFTSYFTIAKKSVL